MMEAASTSETSVNFYQTTRPNNPEDSHLHTRRRKNLKSHKYPYSTIRILSMTLFSGTLISIHTHRKNLISTADNHHSTLRL
jgi:hypothetical protein